MSFRARRLRWLAVGLNALAAIGCAALTARAPDRAAALVAAAGIVFFALAGAGFFMLLRLEIGAAARMRGGR